MPEDWVIQSPRKRSRLKVFTFQPILLGMNARTFFDTVLPLVTNGVLAIGAFLVVPGKFTDSPGLCYLVALSATVAGVVTVGGFLLREVSPRQATASLMAQAIALIFVFAGIYRGFGLNNHAPILEHDVALYFSAVTWTTLGYGDFEPARDLQLIAALEASLGYIFLGLIVGLVANSISNRP